MAARTHGRTLYSGPVARSAGLWGVLRLILARLTASALYHVPHGGRGGLRYLRNFRRWKQDGAALRHGRGLCAGQPFDGTRASAPDLAAAGCVLWLALRCRRPKTPRPFWSGRGGLACRGGLVGRSCSGFQDLARSGV